MQLSPLSSMSFDEQALVASCQAGRLEDFDPLYRQYVQPLYRFTYRRTLSRETAEDIVSITFMRALEKIGTYDPRKAPFGAWLYRIARNAIIDHYRSQKPHEDIETVWDLSSDEDLTQKLDDRLSHAQLRDALRTLEPDKREIVLLRLWEGLSYREIAAITGKSEGNCKVIFSRTVAQLRTQLPLALFLLFLVSPFRP